MVSLELSVRHLGINAPPLENYRKTLFVALLVLIGLLLVNVTTDAEEEEGGASYALAIGVIVLLVVAFLYEMSSLVHKAIAPKLKGQLVCFHCHHLNAMPSPDEHRAQPLVKCGGCKRNLAPERSLIKVNFGSVLTGLGMPKLVEHLGHTSLEYRAWVGVAPSTFVGGDMIKGDKIHIRDTVIDKSTIGSGGPSESKEAERPRENVEAPASGEAGAVKSIDAGTETRPEETHAKPDVQGEAKLENNDPDDE